MKVITTTYKDNFLLFNKHYNFYKKKWGIDKYIALIGVTPHTNKEKLKKSVNCSEKSVFVDTICYRNKNIEIEYIDYGSIVLTFYKDQQVLFDNRWNNFRKLLKISSDKYVETVSNSFVNQLIDNDEFYWFPSTVDIWTLLQNERVWFHYLEFIPVNEFTKNTTLNFCIYGQHNRGCGFNHQPCKFLEKGKMFHTNSRKPCASCNAIQNEKNIDISNLFVCFHFAIVDKKSFIEYKLVKYTKKHINSEEYTTKNIPDSIFENIFAENGFEIYNKVTNNKIIEDQLFIDIGLSYFNKIIDHTLYGDSIITINWLQQYF